MSCVSGVLCPCFKYKGIDLLLLNPGRTAVISRILKLLRELKSTVVRANPDRHLSYPNVSTEEEAAVSFFKNILLPRKKEERTNRKIRKIFLVEIDVEKISLPIFEGFCKSP